MNFIGDYMRKESYLSLYDKEYLNQYNGFIALDIDGVFADTWLNHIRYDHPGIQDPRIKQFLLEYSDYVESRAIGKHDVGGVQFESLAYLCALAAEGKFAFIIVSSWVSNPDTCKGVEALMQSLKINNDLAFVVGQTRGGGGHHREQQFFQWLRDFTCDELENSKEIMAIDDSGYRHFPIMYQNKNLVAPLGRIGFNADDYIRCIRKLRFEEADWYDWCKHGYLTNTELPSLPKEVFSYFIHENLINNVFNPLYEPGTGWRTWYARLKRWCKWRLSIRKQG